MELKMTRKATPQASDRPSEQRDESSRAVVLRTRGRSHGIITRLVSPGDVGELIKPFVYLDYLDTDPADFPQFGFHPHSGIATMTLILSGQAFYKETTGREGIVDTGGIEWLRASGGAWHTGNVHGRERAKGYQLWLALPPELELAEPESQYLGPSEFKTAGPARVIIGAYGGRKSVVNAPAGITLLDVRLQAGESWTFQPPDGQSVAWIASHDGTVRSTDVISAGELVVFEESTRAIEFKALSDAAFILGSAVKHPHDLVTGRHSIHTSEAALEQGEKNIADIGRDLHNKGVL
jgi:redox-sensitive bicupin YhaK (pirin superfamily)